MNIVPGTPDLSIELLSKGNGSITGVETKTIAVINNDVDLSNDCIIIEYFVEVVATGGIDKIILDQDQSFVYTIDIPIAATGLYHVKHTISKSLVDANKTNISTTVKHTSTITNTSVITSDFNVSGSDVFYLMLRGYDASTRISARFIAYKIK